MEEWVGLIKELREFASGNTLVLLYISVAVTKMVLLPVYRSGKELKTFVSAATEALSEGVFSHTEIVTELKALNAILSKQRD